jgi:dienelactone hydrolase
MLTLPKGVEKPPVIILVQGSGQSDMNETIGANQNAPFKDIAHGLAQRGIATLRYNKRYYQFPEKAFADFRVEDEVIADVYAAVDYAMSCGEVDETKIIVLGHSLGGLLAPVIARDNSDVKGIISLAGSPRYLEDIVYDQNAELVNAGALSEEDKAKTLEQVKAEVAKVKKLTADSIKSGAVILGMSEAYWLSLTQSNGGVIAPELDIPMLFMQGGADFQVSPDIDFKAWQAVLAGKDNCTFKLYDGLNHLFMATNGRRDISEYDPAGVVDAAVLDDIAAWVRENF